MGIVITYDIISKGRLFPHLWQKKSCGHQFLEKKDQKNLRSKKEFVKLGAFNNIYESYGNYLDDPLYQWTYETSTRKLGLNTHVAYIHSKFLLMDPLSVEPVVVSGSTNFRSSLSKR
jgi:hypothetical protein